MLFPRLAVLFLGVTLIRACMAIGVVEIGVRVTARLGTANQSEQKQVATNLMLVFV